MKQVRSLVPIYRSIARARSTLVIKRQIVGIYNGRLFARGDIVQIAQAAFVSNPTSNRCGGKLIPPLSSQTRWSVRALHASQVSLQDGTLRPTDRVVSTHPSTFPLHWGKSPYSSALIWEYRSAENGISISIPLYGSRASPMRWFLKMSEILDGAGWRQLQTDVRFLLGAITVSWKDSFSRVRYFLSTRSEVFRSLIARPITCIRTRDLETFSAETEITLTALQIELSKRRNSILSQESYIDGIPTVEIEPSVQNNAISNPTALRITSR